MYMLRVIKRQQQLDAMKNDFISNMTHELRTPVTILRSTHEAIDKFGYINDQERTLRYLQANRQVLDQMDKNIDRILQIAKYENAPVITRTHVNLRQLLTAIAEGFGIGLNYVKTLTQLLGGNITVKSKPGAGSCFRSGSPTCNHSYPPSPAANTCLQPDCRNKLCNTKQEPLTLKNEVLL